MKIAYFDCSSGIAGNMVLGALVDAGVTPAQLNADLRKLQITSTKSQIIPKLQISKIKRNGLVSTFVAVKCRKELHHRNLRDILTIIRHSRLSRQVKKQSAKIFTRLAEAEAEVHAIPVNKVHFHEVGAIDAIIDIVGTCIAIEALGIRKIFSSPLPIGKGVIKHAHGILPIPAPATAELLKGIPTYGVNVKGELVTPTGAAIIITLADGFVDIPKMRVDRIGAGAGSLTFPNLPNILRVFIGEAQLPTQKDAVLQLECNIDDMHSRQFDKVIAGLIKAGALDASISPCRMKKEREAFILTVLCKPEDRDRILKTIYQSTTTLGVRTHLTTREKLNRRQIQVKTRYGNVKVKVGSLGKNILTIAPEYEDYKQLAGKHRIPLQKAYNEVKKEAWKKIFPGK
ncbi:MAG: nickel pincer cofactor biosynthesis protein LarC [Candidatus Margulisbacteria bacterium]|nr:nickel pincer cofactor biosynthesis protein LarC [Candidatus Margulisiibacteriota bacterium]